MFLENSQYPDSVLRAGYYLYALRSHFALNDKTFQGLLHRRWQRLLVEVLIVIGRLLVGHDNSRGRKRVSGR